MAKSPAVSGWPSVSRSTMTRWLLVNRDPLTVGQWLTWCQSVSSWPTDSWSSFLLLSLWS